ncbi:hypothetical protein VTO42DRAFT_4782 [Malbranchea cinnamomea]
MSMGTETGSPGPQHRRNMSVKAMRPRRSTKGPLDAPDDLPNISSDSESLSRSRLTSPSGKEIENLAMGKNFSYLLRQEIYHPLTQLNIPPAFRSEFLNPREDEPLSSSLALLNNLLKEGHFLLAAHFAASILTSSLISPNDHASIFHLLYIRLACLELTGNTILAAQEVKALEDLSSVFYYVDVDLEAAGSGRPLGRGQNIVPWPLRVLAVRLQSIGFGDTRRGITGLYELGLEARRQLQRPEISQEEQAEWRERLADLGLRVVNALIEMGDFDTARRTLASMKPPAKDNKNEVVRMALLNFRIGDIEAARELVDTLSNPNREILRPLLSMAEGRFSEAITEWEAIRDKGQSKNDEAMIIQNLAVCLLYVGKLSESRQLLESLIEQHNSFQSLTFNLATIYELCSENSNALKLELTEKISRHPPSNYSNRERPNTNFKI